ncbi:Ger(x)C family spore germination protein [Paenibacillus sp. T1]|uniref:Ger(X)C family spore germination protein n=2 Tax=Paenibacillus glycinis TaxID=2697035 RepID=A0ABW9XL03_9BACL|nr:Ger(x)C family spore germination protein [Paenibacillus glycinis]
MADMRRAAAILLIASMLAVLPGCKDRLDLEDITLVLMFGLDLDKDNKLVIYASSPVFNKEAKNKNEVTQVNAITLRQSRGELEARVSALVSTGKLQCILIGKKLLQHPEWVKLLDVFYRDSKTRVKARLVAVDGPVADIMYFAPPDKRRLSLHIANLLDTAYERNLVEETSLWEFHRQLHERGRTPEMTELRKNKREVVADSTALLNDDGKYVTSIGIEETELLQILQKDKKSDLSLTLVLPEQEKAGASFLYAGSISFYVLDIGRKVRTAYTGGKFRFDLDFDLEIRLTERFFAFDVLHDAGQLEAQIDKRLQAQMTALIAKLQANRMDPVGLGLHARAFQYAAWKKVQDHWGEAFGQAEFKLRVHAKIVDMGEIT